ncbi:helix-turn-helix transcriptional regulator [Streptomyces sp. NPDC002225]|uniref:helix-turn-helix domain-containing protein n=1 Tax=Streptomyces sp. NPDC002225 TaxID=3154413 RepID=UPI003324E6BC
MSRARVGLGNRVSTVLARQLGGQLLTFREAAGLNQTQAATVLSAQAAKVAKMEHGWVPIRDPDVLALCRAYGVEDPSVIEGMLRLAKLDRERRKARGWWTTSLDPGSLREYVAMEDAALRVRTWQLSLVPGLFQIPEYARALAVAAVSPDRIEEIERVVDVRMHRQRRLHGENPLRVHAVIWEAALRQMIGGPQVMGRQLEHLCRLAEQANIDVQVLPFRAEVNPCSGGPFNILSFADEDAVDVIHMDGLRTTNWVEGKEESTAYSELFARTCAMSLSPYDSVRFIASIAKGMSK